MKKTGYSVTLKHLVNGEPENKGAHGDEAEAIVAMARAHQDIHWDGDDHFLIPWSAVLGVTITKSIEDVSAPYDTICGDCKHPGAYLKVKDGVDFCWVTDIETGDVTVNLKLNGEIVEAPYSAETLASLFELTQDCEPVVIAEGGVSDIVTENDVTVSLYAQNEDGSVVGETEVVFPADDAHHCE